MLEFILSFGNVILPPFPVSSLFPLYCGENLNTHDFPS